MHEGGTGQAHHEESFNRDGHTGDTTQPGARGAEAPSPTWPGPGVDMGEAVLKNTAGPILHVHGKGPWGAARWRACTDWV